MRFRTYALLERAFVNAMQMANAHQLEDQSSVDRSVAPSLDMSLARLSFASTPADDVSKVFKFLRSSSVQTPQRALQDVRTTPVRNKYLCYLSYQHTVNLRR